MTKQLWLWKYLAWLTALLVAATAAVAAQPTGKQLTRLAEEGEGLFNQRCSACHTIGQGDQATGPDLAGVTELREQQWLIDFITNPGKLLAAADPLAIELDKKFPALQMPAQTLKPAQMDALLTYLAHPDEVKHHPPEAAPDKATGDPARGHTLFIGETPFSGGGAPCLACHGIAKAGLGRAAGANYGPDLSSIFTQFGEEGLLSLLVNLPFPSMVAIYNSRPLTESERLDLTAYFAQTAKQAAPPPKSLVWPILLGVIIVFAIVGLTGLRRFKGARQPLVDQVRKQRGIKS